MIFKKDDQNNSKRESIFFFHFFCRSEAKYLAQTKCFGGQLKIIIFNDQCSFSEGRV